MKQEQKDAPLYLKLYEALRDQIIAGDYPYGRKLPGKRTLAEQYGLSLITVEHALTLLQEEGYVSAKERSGVYVTFSALDGFAGVGHSAPAPARRTESENKNESFPFSVLARTMRRVISDYGEDLLIRSPNAGLDELRNAISQYLGRSRGFSVHKDQIVIGAGAEYLYSLLVQILGRDKTYAIEQPSYEKIEQVYRANDVRCLLLPLGQDGVESEALWSCGADVLHLTPYRSFPSGVTATAAKRRDYIRWADAAPRVIIEDDFESEFTPSKKAEETLFSLSEHNNVIYINTFSLTVAPSVRIGYMVLPDPLFEAYRERAGFFSCTAPVFEQLLIARLLQSGDFERHINRVRRKKRKQ